MSGRWTCTSRALLLLLVLAVIGAGLRESLNRATPGDAIVVVALPDDETVSELIRSLGAAGSVEVKYVRRALSGRDDRREARAIGRRYGAALVVWGNRSGLEVDALTQPKALRVPMADDYAAEVTLADPDHLTFPPLPNGDVRALRSFVEGMIRSERGDYAGAIRDLSAVLEQGGPDDFKSKVFVSRGNNFLIWDRLQEAAEDYTKALQLNPKSGEAFVNRGVARWDPTQHQQAAEDFERALKINPEDSLARVNHGVSLTAQGNHQLAIEDYERALGVNPASATAYLDRGVSEAIQGRHRQAVRDFTRTLRINPREATALLNRGLSYAAMGDQQRAVADYSRALEINPRDAPAYYHRGLAYSILRKYGQAIADLSQAIQINPKDAGAYRDRGANHLFLGQHREAVEDASQAIELNPRDAEAYFNRGLSHMIQGESQKAIEDMQKVLEMSRDPSLRKYAEEQLQKLRKEQ